MSEQQQYRVIADRDKSDDPRWSEAQPGDRIVIPRASVDFDDGSPLVRIERPVPATDSQKLAESEDRAPGFSTSPHPPTCEQIAEAVSAEWDRTGSLLLPLPEDRVEELRDRTVDAVLALIQNGADRG